MRSTRAFTKRAGWSLAVGIAIAAIPAAAAGQGSDPGAAGSERLYTQIDVWGDEASEVSFAAPNGLAIDDDGDIYSTEFQGGHLRRFSPDGELRFEVAGAGAALGMLSNPIGVAVAPDGTIYVSESGSSRVSRFASDGTFETAWGEAGSAQGQFFSAMGIAVSDTGDVFVADFGNHRVQAFDGDGGFLRSWGSQGTAPGEFTNPIGLQIDRSDAVWVVDSGNERIQVFDSNGNLERVIDDVGPGPQIISLEADGSFLVSSPWMESNVRSFDADAVFEGFVSDGLDGPHGTVTNAAGTLYVADTANGVIRLFERTVR